MPPVRSPDSTTSDWFGWRFRHEVPLRPRTRSWILTAALVAGALMTVGVVVAAGTTLQAGETDRKLNVLPPLPSDTFAHSRHEKVACLTCHLPRSQAVLTFERPRGCQVCHHSDPTRNDCARCHEPGSLPKTLEFHVAIAAAGRPARDRTVTFPHERHAELRCTACHGEPVTLAPVDSARTCQGCHAMHHEAGRSCATCHRTESIAQTHAQPVRAHVACDACHPTAAIAPLSPTRSFCLVCHDPKVDHNPGRECTACHLQSSPEAYRARLLRRRRTG